MTDDPRMDLTVTVSAAEWGELHRRVSFLQTVLVQLLRDGETIKEWFSAADLAALRLPGLPTAKNAITRMARDNKWKVRPVTCRGGVLYVYHFSDLPRRAFDALVDRIVTAPPEGSELIGNDQPPERMARSKPAVKNTGASTALNAAPPWVLPLMRIIRGEGANVSDALDELPSMLPVGVVCPSREEAIEVLTRLGLVKAS